MKCYDLAAQLVKSHGDDLGLEYLWNMEDNPEILALVHVIERPITVHYEDSDKGIVFGEFFTDCLGIDLIYYPEKRDDKGELIKAGH